MIIVNTHTITQPRRGDIKFENISPLQGSITLLQYLLQSYRPFRAEMLII